MTPVTITSVAGARTAEACLSEASPSRAAMTMSGARNYVANVLVSLAIVVSDRVKSVEMRRSLGGGGAN